VERFKKPVKRTHNIPRTNLNENQLSISRCENQIKREWLILAFVVLVLVYQVYSLHIFW
jgi:hypothetical protein